MEHMISEERLQPHQKNIVDNLPLKTNDVESSKTDCPKHNASKKIKMILDDLEQDLCEIKTAVLNQCSSQAQINHMKVVFGISRLDDLEFASDEFKPRINELRMQYLKASNTIFGFDHKEYHL